MKLLRIDSSARRNSVSRQMTAHFAEAWKRKHPDGEVIERDLDTTHLPLITDEWVQASHSDPARLTPEQKRAIAVSDLLIAEVQDADEIVIGSPMHNFTVPALLKAWIDQVVRVGKTVLYDTGRLRGVFENKKVYIVTSRGGAYAPGTPAQRFDYQEPYLRHVLAFVGLTDVTFIHAENQKPGQAGDLARAAALAQIDRLAAAGAS